MPDTGAPSASLGKPPVALVESAQAKLKAANEEGHFAYLTAKEVDALRYLCGLYRIAEEIQKPHPGGHIDGSECRHTEEPQPDLRTVYPEVGKFATLMRRELWANRGKGDQAVWQNTDPRQLTYDISWHLIKLMAAIKQHDLYGIQEHSADVANMAMMACDAASGLLNVTEP